MFAAQGSHAVVLLVVAVVRQERRDRVRLRRHERPDRADPPEVIALPATTCRRRASSRGCRTRATGASRRGLQQRSHRTRSRRCSGTAGHVGRRRGPRDVGRAAVRRGRARPRRSAASARPARLLFNRILDDLAQALALILVALVALVAACGSPRRACSAAPCARGGATGARCCVGGPAMFVGGALAWSAVGRPRDHPAREGGRRRSGTARRG